MNPARQQEKELVIQVLKMVHYLPEVQQLYKFFPFKRLLMREGSDLTLRVPEMSYSDIADSE